MQRAATPLPVSMIPCDSNMFENNLLPDLEAALMRWASGESWQTALGLNRRQCRNILRDHELRQALQLIGGDVRELHAAVSRFESCVWPRWRRSGLPADAGSVNASIFRARQFAGSPLPKSLKQYRRILDKYPLS